MANVRASDPFVCVWCEGEAHSRCIGRVCECEHTKEEPWIAPTRRQELRAGAEPVNHHETEYRSALDAHQEARRAADEHRA